MAPLAASQRQWLPLPRRRSCLACQPSRPWRRKRRARRRGPTCSGMRRQEQRARPRRAAAVPLPKPRPAEAPSAEREQPDEGAARRPAETASPTEQAAPAPQPPPQPSACRLALTDAIAIAPSIPDIHGAGGCGGEDLVRLEAIVLPDKRQVSVKPAAILRCTMASALADWIRNDIAPLAAAPRQHRSPISTISTRSSAAAATASSAPSSPSTAAPMRSTFAPSSSPTAARSR